MKKKYIRLIVWAFVFILLVWVANFTIVGYFLKRNYMYSNYNGTFRYAEDRLKGGISYKARESLYSTFLMKHPDIKDKQLYRRFWLNPWFFWEWREWVEHFDRFTLPYISEKEIQRNREAGGGIAMVNDFFTSPAFFCLLSKILRNKRVYFVMISTS